MTTKAGPSHTGKDPVLLGRPFPSLLSSGTLHSLPADFLLLMAACFPRVEGDMTTAVWDYNLKGLIREN